MTGRTERDDDAGRTDVARVDACGANPARTHGEGIAHGLRGGFRGGPGRGRFMYRYTTCIVFWWCVHVGASHAPLTKAAPGGGRWDRAGRGSSSAPFHGQASGRIDERFTDTVSCMMDGQRRDEMYLSFHHQEGEKKRTKKRRTTPHVHAIQMASRGVQDVWGHHQGGERRGVVSGDTGEIRSVHKMDLRYVLSFLLTIRLYSYS